MEYKKFNRGKVVSVKITRLMLYKFFGIEDLPEDLFYKLDLDIKNQNIIIHLERGVKGDESNKINN